MHFLSMVEWDCSEGLTDYELALKIMQQRVQNIAEGEADELVWLLQHPSLYTAGTSAKRSDLLDARFPVYEAGRGGEYTYHGPGQRVAYAMLDLNQRGRDVRAYVKKLEQWIILTLREFGIEGFTRKERIGVWVHVSGPIKTEKKIAALGIRLRKWVSFHGIALNVMPDLSHYSGIVPCGISDYGVTSFQELGIDASMKDIDAALQKQFSAVFESAA